MDKTELSKIERSIERIKYGSMINNGEPLYLCQSGGKDSCVIEALTKASCVSYTSNYNITGLDHPALIYHLRKHYPNTIWHRPEKILGELLVEKKAPPTRIQRWCCEKLKEGSGQGVVILGIRWAESANRKKRRWTEICKKNKQKTFVSPIIDWSDDDVWGYIKNNNLPYCKLYDAPYNYSRLGCIMCPMAPPKQRKKESVDYPGYKKLYKIWFTRILKAREEAGLTISDQWLTVDKLFAWWIEDKEGTQELNGQQCLAFDN